MWRQRPGKSQGKGKKRKEKAFLLIKGNEVLQDLLPPAWMALKRERKRELYNTT